MSENKYEISVTDYERRTLIGVLAEKRNECLNENIPADDVNDLLEKALDAHVKKPKRISRDER